jgi:hypothetical protein
MTRSKNFGLAAIVGLGVGFGTMLYSGNDSVGEELGYDTTESVRVSDTDDSNFKVITYKDSSFSYRSDTDLSNIDQVVQDYDGTPDFRKIVFDKDKLREFPDKEKTYSSRFSLVGEQPSADKRIFDMLTSNDDYERMYYDIVESLQVGEVEEGYLSVWSEDEDFEMSFEFAHNERMDKPYFYTYLNGNNFNFSPLIENRFDQDNLYLNVKLGLESELKRRLKNE